MERLKFLHLCNENTRRERNPTLEIVAHYSLLAFSVEEEKCPPMVVMVAAGLRGGGEVFCLREFLGSE